MSITYYLVNRIPSCAIDFNTLKEMWTRKPPGYYHLSVFGYIGYVHQNEGNLEPRSMKCMFLRYLEGVKGYRLWLKDSYGMKVIISRVVIFNEFEMFSSKENLTYQVMNSNCNSRSGFERDYLEFEFELVQPDIDDQHEDLNGTNNTELSDETQREK